MSAERMAVQRDAAWTSSVGRGGTFHIVSDHDPARPACGARVVLQSENAEPASGVEAALRCRRPGCRGKWEAA